MSIPNNALEFVDRFRTEQDCLLALVKLRWPKGFICPNCGHDDGYELKRRRLIQCTVCRHQTSVTAGTLFHRTRVPLRKWFWMIYMVTQDKGGASASRLAVHLGMYYKTVWHMLQKLRHAMGRRDEKIMLSGVIELDEAIIGRHARKTGRVRKPEQTQAGRTPRPKRLGRRPSSGVAPKTQTEVVVAVEETPHGAGFLAMQVVYQASRETIEEVVEQRVLPNQFFKTDAIQYHFVLRSMGHLLDARVSSGPIACKFLPIVHRAISLLKRFLIGTYHGVSSRYLQRYLQEFCFRFNRKHKENLIFHSLLFSSVSTCPMTYAELKL